LATIVKRQPLQATTYRVEHGLC